LIRIEISDPLLVGEAHIKICCPGMCLS
jgi:hypothetical protein